MVCRKKQNKKKSKHYHFLKEEIVLACQTDFLSQCKGVNLVESRNVILFTIVLYPVSIVAFILYIRLVFLQGLTHFKAFSIYNKDVIMETGKLCISILAPLSYYCCSHFSIKTKYLLHSISSLKDQWLAERSLCNL